MNLTSDQLENALLRAPRSIQFFIEEGLLADKLSTIAKRNALPISIAPSFARLGEAALLGLVPPAQFTEELVNIGVPPTGVQKISASFFEEVVKVASETSVPVEETGLNLSEEVSGGIEQRMLPEGHHEVQKTAVVPPKTQVPAPIKVTPVQQKVSVSPASNYPRTMASDVEAMQGGGKPVAPRPAPPPTPRPIPPSRPAPTVATVQEDLKKYGVDPYREPVA